MSNYHVELIDKPAALTKEAIKSLRKQQVQGLSRRQLMRAALVPYIDRANIHVTRPSERKFIVTLFSLFCVLGLFLTFVGIFFRGPGYSFVIPYLPFFENSSEGLHFAL